MAAADAAKKEKNNKPPKGFAQLPEWWMEITPHDTLDIDEDEAKRLAANHQARVYKDLASKSDWEEMHGESKYSVGKNGELIDKATGKPIETGGSSGYTRDEKTGEWMKDGKKIFGRSISTSGTSSTLSSAGVSSPSYGHKDMNWKKPDWMKVSSCPWYSVDRFYSFL